MDPHRDTIAELIRTLVRRERALLLLRVVGQAALLGVLVLLLAVISAWTGADRGVMAFLLMTLGGAGAWLVIALPLMIGWRRAGDLRRQARRVEALRPALQGRLLTTVERLDGPRGQESAAILGLVARRAMAHLVGLTPARVHSAWPAASVASALMAALVFTVVSSLLVPGGPLGVLGYWLDGDRAMADVADPGKGVAGDHARVGDLVLEYVYPTYTGLDPLQVPNSTGEAHGPPGTLVRVRARSADPVTSASVVAYGEPADDSLVDDGRIVSGSFTVRDVDGTWFLELSRGEQARASREFSITVEPDLAPEVMLDGPPRLRVPINELVEVPWLVRDDYGLVRVAMLIDGTEVVELRAFGSRTAEAGGTLRFTPAELGLSVGMRVKLQVAAWDNNGWSGSQQGVSEPGVEIEVLGPDDVGTLSAEERLALRDTLLDLLAGQVTFGWPPGSTSASVARGGETFDRLYEPLRAFIVEHPDVRRDRLVRRLIGKVLESGVDFVAYTQVNFDPQLVGERADPERIAQSVELLATAVAEDEYAIILLDRFGQMLGLREVVQTSKVLASVGSRLEGLLDDRAPDADVTQALEQVRAGLESLDRSVAFMDEDGTRSMVERRRRELGRITDEVAQAQVEGRTIEAIDLAGRLSRQLIELRADLEYRLKSVEDEDNALQQQMKDLVQELNRLEREQRQLQGRVREVRQSNDAQGAAEAERLWAEVERLADLAAQDGNMVVEGMGGTGRQFWVREIVSSATRASERVVESAQARDLRKTSDDLDVALGSWFRVAGARSDPTYRGIIGRLEQAQRLLQRLEADASNVDPRTAAQSRAMRGDQGELATDLQSTRELAQQVINEMPIEPRGMMEALGQASGNMGQARSDLDQGRPMPAEGAQGQAAERIKEAREALEQAIQEMAAAGAGDGDPQDGESDEGNGADDAELDLDASDLSRARDIDLEEQFDLDAFQRDVLRGMQGDVPDAYRAMKKRYYEELMTQ